ncbi:MAG: hypothetical protein A2W31_08950 [Planctomycetes bacterium RBG_16_64_10]|nr:MAG: hypothetical protein A2W31_08950 [Planctomycetes bacterium RBG_16_64_10]
MFRRKSKRKPQPVKAVSAPTKAVSAPTRGRGIIVPKPPMNIDTVLLGIALVAITIGCLLLLLEIFQYGGVGAVKGPA